MCFFWAAWLSEFARFSRLSCFVNAVFCLMCWLFWFCWISKAFWTLVFKMLCIYLVFWISCFMNCFEIILSCICHDSEFSSFSGNLYFLDLLKFYVFQILFFFLVPWFVVFWFAFFDAAGFVKKIVILAYKFDMSDRSGISDIYFYKNMFNFTDICIFDLSAAGFYIIFPKRTFACQISNRLYVVLMIVVFFGLSV